MGGLCCTDGKTVGTGKATDNFALVEEGFQIDDVTYYSSEHAYQALKMRTKADRHKLARLVPKPKESAWDYGMRCWNAGQRGQPRRDWEANGGTVKIQAMYACNKAKLEQCEWMREELCASVGELKHRGSGAFWDRWNPILLTLIREELRPLGARDAGLISQLQRQMGLPVAEAAASAEGGNSVVEDTQEADHAAGQIEISIARSNVDALEENLCGVKCCAEWTVQPWSERRVSPGSCMCWCPPSDLSTVSECFV